MKAYLRFFSLLGGVFFLDQLTKRVIAQTLPLGTYWNPPAVPVAGEWFYFVHVGNQGAAWGLFEEHTAWLAALGVLFFALIYGFRHEFELGQPRMQYAFGLIAGGVLGNLWDRIKQGYVVDFIDVHLTSDYRFPAFNVADSAITVGIVFYVLWSLFSRPTSKKRVPAEGSGVTQTG